MRLRFWRFIGCAPDEMWCTGTASVSSSPTLMPTKVHILSFVTLVWWRSGVMVKYVDATLPVSSTARATESSRWTQRRDCVRCRTPHLALPSITPARAHAANGRRLAWDIIPNALDTRTPLRDSNTEPRHSPLRPAEIAPDSLAGSFRSSQDIARVVLIVHHRSWAVQAPSR